MKQIYFLLIISIILSSIPSPSLALPPPPVTIMTTEALVVEFLELAIGASQRFNISQSQSSYIIHLSTFLSALTNPRLTAVIRELYFGRGVAIIVIEKSLTTGELIAISSAAAIVVGAFVYITGCAVWQAYFNGLSRDAAEKKRALSICETTYGLGNAACAAKRTSFNDAMVLRASVYTAIKNSLICRWAVPPSLPPLPNPIVPFPAPPVVNTPAPCIVYEVCCEYIIHPAGPSPLPPPNYACTTDAFCGVLGLYGSSRRVAHTRCGPQLPTPPSVPTEMTTVAPIRRSAQLPIRPAQAPPPSFFHWLFAPLARMLGF